MYIIHEDVIARMEHIDVFVVNCLVEGRAAVVFAEKTVEMGAGEVLMVPANTRHAIEAKGSFKVLQLTL